MPTGKSYKFEEYSIFDIMEYLEKKEFEIIFCQKGEKDSNYLEWKKETNDKRQWERGHAHDMINVKGTDIY